MPQLINCCHRDVPLEEWEGLDHSAKFAVMQDLAAELQVKIAESWLRNDDNQGKAAGAPCWRIFSLPGKDSPALIRIEVQILANMISRSSDATERDE